ncbi:hypothetical protein [Chitinilyticum piscinae]|uniref:Uncharacterized protein n=1 Tax=Chitinilyticum piscinae TaxID=2866724 RepID=A0A8J7G412_9NEIS|nr:hypothetical protein [Chitinilyticum piscinae]MBE9611048.1 hypothetical protein [Chitinilyticum piscinae]
MPKRVPKSAIKEAAKNSGMTEEFMEDFLNKVPDLKPVPEKSFMFNADDPHDPMAFFEAAMMLTSTAENPWTEEEITEVRAEYLDLLARGFPEEE